MRRLETKRRLADCLAVAGAVLAILCLAFIPTFAQQGKDTTPHFAGDIENLKPLPPGGPAPRTADGHPDLSGVWYPNLSGTEMQAAYSSASSDVDSAREEARDELPSFKPGMAAKYRVPPTTDYGECAQAGTPVTAGNFTFPIQLIQTPGLLLLLDEYPMDYRVIRTDGRPHPKDPDPSFNGNSVGHWEGDTLVIDTIALDTRRANGGRPPWLHSDQEHVIERLSRPSMNYFTYQVTIEDPVVLSKPWNLAARRWSRSIHEGEDLGEFFCTNNEEPAEWQKITGGK